eukprot:g70927.t1
MRYSHKQSSLGAPGTSRLLLCTPTPNPSFQNRKTDRVWNRHPQNTAIDGVYVKRSESRKSGQGNWLQLVNDGRTWLRAPRQTRYLRRNRRVLPLYHRGCQSRGLLSRHSATRYEYRLSRRWALLGEVIPGFTSGSSPLHHQGFSSESSPSQGLMHPFFSQSDTNSRTSTSHCASTALARSRLAVPNDSQRISSSQHTNASKQCL